MYNRILRLIAYFKRFIYYGYVGANDCRDYDANGVFSLIRSHLLVVNKFMKSDNTHLMWNDKIDTNLMKRLAELTELSKIIKKGSYNYYYTQFMENNPDIWGIDSLNRQDAKYTKKIRLAFKRDRMIYSQREERFWYLFKKYINHFWD